MAGVFFYEDGAYEALVFKRPYVKYNNVWTGCRSIWAKDAGVWKPVWQYDTTPPDKPELSLILVEDRYNDGSLKTRYIRVGVRMPKVNHDPTVPQIRVLTDYNDAAPTTPLGGTYTAEPDNDYPGEPWSEWRYDGSVYGTGAPHQDNSKLIYKQWPRNAGDGTQLRGDKHYHFGAWAMDENGNWSGGQVLNLYIPKGGVDEPRTKVREATFYPNAAGSWTKVGKVASGPNKGDYIWGWVAGNLEQQKAPRSQGLWLYGGQFHDSVPANATIKKFEIYAVRTNDAGVANAHLTIFWHPYGQVSGLPASSRTATITTNQENNLGNISKGEGKWFDLPGQFRDDFKNGNMKGVGFSYHRPGAAAGDANADDYSMLAWNTGQIHVVWEEPA